MSKLKFSEIKNIIKFICEDYIDGIEENTDDEGNIVGFTDKEGNILGYEDENILIEDFKLFVDVYKDFDFKGIK
tara:strand:- start:228 stop:449 length:222 start_codon:yes stop_codon:yes gene_type:complete